VGCRIAQWAVASAALIRALTVQIATTAPATTAWSVSGRHWVRHGGRGGRKALLDRLDGAVRAIPASLDLSAPA